MEKDHKATGLVPRFTPLAIWAFSIGTSIGWGSFIVTCNTYLQKSGILGTVFGLLIGMAVVLVITWNLQAMIRRSPDAGGIYTFEKKVAGRDLGFLAFWFVLLTYWAILWANMTSLPLFARFFLGDTFQFGFHYQIFGYEVWLGEALLSTCSAALIGLLCAKSVRLPNKVMVVSALTFAVSFAACAVIVLLRHEGAFSFDPLYTEGSSAFIQVIRIAAISPWAFIGFENVSHFSEEYAFPVRRIRGILICSVIVTTVIYLAVSALSISAYPPEYESWLAYIQDMGNLGGIKAVPAFYVAQHYLGDAGVVALMLALFGVILTSLIGNMLALSRLLYAAGRDGEAPRALSRLSDRGIPVNAIIVVVGVSALVPFLGRTAIGWIVDVTTLCATIIYGLISHGVYVSSKRDGERVEMCTGIVGIVLMVCFVLLLLVPGLLPFDTMATESYFLFIVWSVLGLAYFRRLRRERNREYGKSAVVWVALLVLVLFASMMWVSQATERAANQAVERIFQYHQTHPDDNSKEGSQEERELYLQEQAEQISHTNTMYSAVSLGVFLLSLGIMVDGLRENRELGQQLVAAELEAKTAKEIAELKGAINSLFDNMPAISHSKDAETGRYVACNQAFAEFANKKSPDEVVGLTDYEIFGREVAKHFEQDDKRALQMDSSLVLFEEVTDAVGRPRKLQTTKLKFYDASGRLCTMGMSVDVRKWSWPSKRASGTWWPTKRRFRPVRFTRASSIPWPGTTSTFTM
jgi:amino acid transporter